MTGCVVVVVMHTCMIGTHGGSQSRSELVPLVQQCTCLGFQLVYECTVMGEAGATVWTGSIFQCPSTGNTITLRHSAFNQMRGCNQGAIIGYGVNTQNGCYTSQINITTSLSMNNKTVECVYNNGSTTSVIGTSVVIVISGIELACSKQAQTEHA